MADQPATRDGFVTAYPPGGGDKRRVPVHYLQEPFDYKLPPSAKAADKPSRATRVQEPATPETKKEERP